MSLQAKSVFYREIILDGKNGSYTGGGILSMNPCGFTLGRYLEAAIIAAVGVKNLVNLVEGSGGRIPEETRLGAVEIFVVKLR